MNLQDVQQQHCSWETLIKRSVISLISLPFNKLKIRKAIQMFSLLNTYCFSS